MILGEVFLDDVPQSVTLVPRLTPEGIGYLSNFRGYTFPDSELFASKGPHIEILCYPEEFLEAVQPGNTVNFSAIRGNGALGTICMLKGRAACDFPSSTKLITSLQMFTEVKGRVTRITFHGRAEYLRLPNVKPAFTERDMAPVSFALWFEIDPDGLEEFVPSPLLRAKLVDKLFGATP